MKIQPYNGDNTKIIPWDKRDPWTLPDSPEQMDYVRLMHEMSMYFRESSLGILQAANGWWDLFLAQQEDTRDQIDEQWRSDAFIPLPFSITRTKAASTVELLGNTEPVWQVEAVRETGQWYENSKQFERLLDYVHRMNAWRKFLYKVAVSRSVQGTSFIKVVWAKRSHVITLFPTPGEQQRFDEIVQENMKRGAPDPAMYPGGFEKWQKDIALAGTKFLPVPSPPVGGPREVIQYEGPLFKLLPLWTVGVDPMIDEMDDQRVIVHTMIKPLSSILARADLDPKSPMPFYKDAVEAAMSGWDGEVLTSEQAELAESLGLNPQVRTNPYYQQAVKIQEFWSRDEKYKYAVVMNERQIINKRPREWPLLTHSANIFAARNVVVPGHFYGLSDYQEPEKLFKELNTFRRIRMDGAMLTTLPVFTKTAGTVLSDAMKKIKPGQIITLPTKDAIQSLIRHTMPAEAYREPAEIKMEIEDATEVYSSTKGAPATIGRVTGVEFQGRSGQVSIKQKVDVAILEEELLMLPSVILSMLAQMGPEKVIHEIGGDPSALVSVTREQLIQAINYQFRFRGATKHINPDLQVQQLIQTMNQMKDVLTPVERRFGLQLIMELLDIRGYSKILTLEGTTQQGIAGGLAMGATNAQNANTQQQAEMGNVSVPPVISNPDASTMQGGSSAPTS